MLLGINACTKNTDNNKAIATLPSDTSSFKVDTSKSTTVNLCWKDTNSYGKISEICIGQLIYYLDKSTHLSADTPKYLPNDTATFTGIIKLNYKEFCYDESCNYSKTELDMQSNLVWTLNLSFTAESNKQYIYTTSSLPLKSNLEYYFTNSFTVDSITGSYKAVLAFEDGGAYGSEELSMGAGYLYMRIAAMQFDIPYKVVASGTKKCVIKRKGSDGMKFRMNNVISKKKI